MIRDDELQDAQLRAVAARLGQRAAEQFDVERTAAAVVRRLREEPTGQVWWMRPVWLRIAAGVVLLLGAGVVYQDQVSHPRPCPAAICATDDGVSLSSDQLRAVLRSLGAGDTGVTETVEPVTDAGLEELNAAQLQELLHSLEG